MSGMRFKMNRMPDILHTFSLGFVRMRFFCRILIFLQEFY